MYAYLVLYSEIGTSLTPVGSGLLTRVLYSVPTLNIEQFEFWDGSLKIPSSGGFSSSATDVSKNPPLAVVMDM